MILAESLHYDMFAWVHYGCVIARFAGFFTVSNMLCRSITTTNDANVAVPQNNDDTEQKRKTEVVLKLTMC